MEGAKKVIQLTCKNPPKPPRWATTPPRERGLSRSHPYTCYVARFTCYTYMHLRPMGSDLIFFAEKFILFGVWLLLPRHLSLTLSLTFFLDKKLTDTIRPVDLHPEQLHGSRVRNLARRQGRSFLLPNIWSRSCSYHRHSPPSGILWACEKTRPQRTSRQPPWPRQSQTNAGPWVG